MSNETRLFSSRLNGSAAADGKEEERVAGWVGGWGGGVKSGDCIKQPWKRLLENKLRSAGQRLFFASRSIFHHRKKKIPLGKSQHFPLRSRSPLQHSGAASSEPVIPGRARPPLHCAWHILEGSHCGMWRGFSFHPSQRKS